MLWKMHSVTPEIDLLRHGKKVKQRIMTSKFFLSTTFFLLPLSLLLKSHLSKPQRSSWYIGCRFPCNQTNDNKTDLGGAEAEMGAKKGPPKRHFNWRHHLQLEKQRKESENMNYYVTCNEAKRTSRITILLCSLRKGFLALLPSLITFSVRQ